MSGSKKGKDHSGKRQQYLFEEIIAVLKRSGNKTLNYKQVAAKLKIFDAEQRQMVHHLLRELVDREVVQESARGKYRLKLNDKYVLGKVDMTLSGSAYITSPDLEEDVFVMAKNLGTAFHGDEVRVYIFPKRKSRKLEGKVEEVIKRRKSTFVGTVQHSGKFAFLVAEDQRIGMDIFLPEENINGAEDGEKVIVEVVEWPGGGRSPVGKVTQVLGDPGDHEVEMHAILAEYGLPYRFPEEVERMAELLPVEITKEDIAARKDFRKTTTFTIDPADAKDFDDALSIRALDNGNWEVGVHIADVSHYVLEDSVLDREAYQRATSVYLVDRVVPMLPEVLSNGICSLRPQEEKLCYAAVFELSEEGKVEKEWFGRTIIYSDRRFTYEEAQAVIETGEGDFNQEILKLNELAKKLRTKRFKKGSLFFDKVEVKFHLDESGHPTGVYFKEMKDANRLIEDFMLLANRRVATFIANKEKEGQKKRFPFVYRVHDTPNEEKLEKFSGFISKFGHKLNLQSGKKTMDSMNKVLQDVKGKPEANMVEILAIRSMAKAVYTANNIGHYGLGFDHYTHFTSPIRRYPDVMVHRLLTHYLNKGKPVNEDTLEEHCEHCSEREKMAAEAERESIKYKQVEFLQDKVGQQFDGVISGVTEWGVYVEIAENKCEGMVRLKDMTDDLYWFDEDNYCVVGRRNKKKYTLGDQVKIEIRRADLIRKQLDFLFVEDEFDYGFEI